MSDNVRTAACYAASTPRPSPRAHSERPPPSGPVVVGAAASSNMPSVRDPFLPADVAPDNLITVPGLDGLQPLGVGRQEL